VRHCLKRPRSIKSSAYATNNDPWWSPAWLPVSGQPWVYGVTRFGRRHREDCSAQLSGDYPRGSSLPHAVRGTEHRKLIRELPKSVSSSYGYSLVSLAPPPSPCMVSYRGPGWCRTRPSRQWCARRLDPGWRANSPTADDPVSAAGPYRPVAVSQNMRAAGRAPYRRRRGVQAATGICGEGHGR
jgi:hypothetical protein